MPIVYYIAYGSNMHPFRLAARVPSAKAIGKVEMRGNRLVFHKRSQDNSGKCTIDEAPSWKSMWGVLYEFHSRDRVELDRAEGQGYYPKSYLINVNGGLHPAYIYVAHSAYLSPALQPYDWYKRMVILGATYHQLPEEYVALLRSVRALPDPDPVRRASNEHILRQMLKPRR